LRFGTTSKQTCVPTITSTKVSLTPSASESFASCASQLDFDYLHIVNWKRAEEIVAAGKFKEINGIRVKYWEPDESFVASFKALTTPLFDASDGPLQVAGSGQWGGQAHDTYERTGRTLDLMYLCGGGIVSHPGGPGAGVKAVKQAWEAAVAGVPLDVYAKDHQELAQSIVKFADGKGA